VAARSSTYRGRFFLKPGPRVRETEQRVEKLRAYVRQQETPNTNGLEDFRNVFGPGLDYGKIRAIL